MKVYTVCTSDGSMRGEWDSLEEAAEAVARRFGWEEPYLSIRFSEVDEGVERDA
jgi:hypothetical protein